MHRSVAGATAVLFLLAGCAYRPGGPQTLSLVEEVPAARALVTPPPGGPPVVTVIESRYSDALQQKILLGNDSGASGDNYIDAAFYGPANDPNVPWGRTLGYDNGTFHDIEREMVRALPTVRMRASPYYVQNGYGPFGYAMGRSGQTNCLYGWQLVERQPNVNGERPRLGRVRIRVRLCSATASEQQLLRFMYGYTLNGTFLSPGWDPFEAPPTDPRIGQTGAPILPGPNGDNPYYTEIPPDPREPTVLPRQAAVRRGSTARAVRPAAAAGPQDATAQPLIDPPLGLPGALPPGTGTAVTGGEAAIRGPGAAAGAPPASAALPAAAASAPATAAVPAAPRPAAPAAASAVPIVPPPAELRGTSGVAGPAVTPRYGAATSAAPAADGTTLAPIVPPPPTGASRPAADPATTPATGGAIWAPAAP